MAGFKVEKQTAGAVVLDDLGITLTGAAGTIVDLTDLGPENIARSADLLAAIPALVLVVDARDDTDATIMSSADSTQAVQNHNDTHFGISGGRFGAVDDPTVTPTDDYILQYNLAGDAVEYIDPATLITQTPVQEAIEDVVGGMGVNGTDTTFTYLDGAGTIEWSVNDVFLRNTGDTLDSGTLTIASGAAVDFPTGSSLTIAGDVSAATIETPGGGFVNDNDLINKAYVDAIAAGLDWKESVRVATVPTDILGGLISAQDETSYDGAGSNGTFVGGDGVGGTAYVAADTITLSDGTIITVDAVDGNGDVTDFTVTTAGTNNTDGTVLTQVSTSGTGTSFTLTPGTNNIDGLYSTSPSNGQLTGVDLSSGTGITIDGLNFTGSSATGLVIGDRVLIKDQADAEQNGIYFIDAGSVAASVILTRAEDQDGTPASEVSGGNAAYVEDTTDINAGSVNSTTGWVVSADGNVTLNTDDVDWVQFSGANTIIAGIGLTNSGLVYDVNVDDATTATVVGTDTILFHDADGSASASGSQTRKTTFTSVFNELNVVNGITANGFVVRTADDTYASREIEVEGAGNLDGLAINDGDGIAGNPTIGLDIQNLPARSTAVDTTDRVPVWRADGTDANEYYTISEIAGAVGASDSFATWARTGNGSGASLVADSSADTVTLDGGIGIDLTFTPGTDTVSFAFTNSGMADTPTVLADTVPFFDASNADEPEYRSWSDIISDLSIVTGTGDHFSFIAGGDGGTTAAAIGADTITVNGTGINVTTTNGGAGLDTLDLVLDISDLPAGAGTVDTTDGVAVDEGGTTSVYLWSDVITDLGLQTNSYTTVGGDSGTATASGSDTINLIGGTNGGITTTASEPGTDQVTFDLTPIDLTTGGATLAVGDFIIVSDSADTATTVALKYTFGDMITDLGILTTTTGVTNAFGLITGGDGGTATAIGTDTITFNGTGINIVATNAGAGADDVAFVLDISDLAAGGGTILTTDGVAVNDGGTTVQYLWSDVISDLGLLTAVTASADEDLLGIDVTGSSVIGLDILGLTDPDDDMAAADEFPVHDKSEGTAGANRKITGQNVADGVATILGITDLTFATFTAVTTPANDQTLLAYTDATRSKVLSVESQTFQWADNKVKDNDWLNVGNASDAESGWVMPFNGTIVGVTAHTEDTGGGNTYDIDVYIDAVDSGAVATLTGGANASDTDPTLDIDFSAGDKLRLRADQTGGSGDMEDITVALLVKWRS